MYIQSEFSIGSRLPPHASYKAYSSFLSSSAFNVAGTPTSFEAVDSADWEGESLILLDDIQDNYYEGLTFLDSAMAASIRFSDFFKKSFRKESYKNLDPLVWGSMAHNKKASLKALEHRPPAPTPKKINLMMFFRILWFLRLKLSALRSVSATRYHGDASSRSDRKGFLPK